MPSEKSSSKGLTKKTAQGKSDASKNVGNDSIAGKKRKKKKEADGEKTTSKKDSKSLTKEGSCALQRKQESCSIAVKKSVRVSKASALSHHGVHQTRQEEQCCCSSSSSLENSRPDNKIGRFEEYSSSDTMSTNRLAAMELSSCSNSTPSHASSPFRSKTSFTSARSADSLISSPQPSVALSHASQAHTQTSNRNLGLLNSVTVSTCNSTGGACNTVSEMKSGLVSYCGTDEIDLQSVGSNVTKDSSGRDARESLRWEQECSDEEREEERIELYKENRRKRYLNVLDEHKSKLSERTRQFYVCPSNSV